MSEQRFVFDGKNIYDKRNSEYLETVDDIVKMLNLLNQLNNNLKLSGGY